MAPIIVRTRGNVTGLDHDRRDAGVVKHNAEEGEASPARRRRNKTGENKCTVSVEVLDLRASTSHASSNAIWLINICEHRAKTSNSCRDKAIGTRNGEGRFGNVASHRSEQTGETEGSEDVPVRWIAKQHGQSSLRPARGRSLRKAQPGCLKLAAPGVQEGDERIRWGCCVQDVGIATVPVDLPPTLWPEGAWVIEIVGIPKTSSERIYCTLNRGSGWSGRLEYGGRNIVPGLCLSSLAHRKEHRQQAKGGYDSRRNWQLYRCMLFFASSRRLIV